MRNIKDASNLDYAVELTSDCLVRCVCHIINRAMVDASALIESEVKKLRELLKIC